MKYFIYLSLLISLGAKANEKFDDSMDFTEDKQQHLAACTGLSAMTWAAARAENEPKGKSYLYAVTFATSVGLMKELSDKHFSKEDMAYNLMGALIGPFLIWEF